MRTGASARESAPEVHTTRAPRLQRRSALIRIGPRGAYGTSVRMYLATASTSSGFSTSRSGFMFLPLPFVIT